MDAMTMSNTKKERRVCHECQKRRIKCDGIRPGCEKCSRKGLNCSGYGIRYRFTNVQTTHDGDTQQPYLPRGAERCEDAIAGQLSSSLLWPDGTWTRSKNAESTTKRQSPKVKLWVENKVFDFTTDASMTHAQNGSIPLHENGGSQPIEAVAAIDSPMTLFHTDAVEDTPCLQDVDTNGRSIRTLQVPFMPRPIEKLNAKSRELFDHFSSTIAPVMVVADSKFNGYRNLLLPLACEDSLVHTAICVASLSFLAHQQPEMQHKAQLGFQSVLTQLRLRTTTTPHLADPSAWAAIIILLTAETISGGTNLPYLFKILQHLASANASCGQTSVMHTFLSEQTRMMTLFAHPLLEEESGTLTLTCRSGDLDFISNIAIFRPELAAYLDIYKTAVHSACDIYVKRATIDPSHMDTIEDLDRLKALCECISAETPGHHALVWVYFVAAAESSTSDHRAFFTLRLQEVFVRTKFHNIPVALATLQDIWKMQAVRKWTEIVPVSMPVFII